MKISIPEPLGDELEFIARQENRSVDEILESIVRQFVAAHSRPGSPPDDQPQTKDLFALIAKAADELGENSKEDNISERSREILLTEYLKR